MGYESWLTAHTKKHSGIAAKLSGLDTDEILEYFLYENMVKNEPDFCPLYQKNKKCHDIEGLNCYLCACPNFRFSDTGLKRVPDGTVFSECAVKSVDGRQKSGGGKIHQDCSGCAIPHKKEYIAEIFDLRLDVIMGSCKSMGNNIEIINGDLGFLDRFDGECTFVLAGGYTKTAEIEGITVAGLPGFIEYTPALDMEVLHFGYPKSMPDIAKAPDGPPSPVLIAMAAKELAPFALEFVDTGLTVVPKCPHTKVGDGCAESILKGSGVEAKKLYDKGALYGQSIKDKSDYFILSECVPAGTTTAYAVVKAMGYECDGYFASSSAESSVKTLKQATVDNALSNIGYDKNDPFDVISKFGDTMQPFIAGAATELSKYKPVILGGGTQMAAVCALIKAISGSEPFSNISLITTEWIAKDKNSDIRGLLSKIEGGINAFYPAFNFANSKYKNLRIYEEGAVKEGIGAGAVAAHSYMKGVSGDELLAAIEEIYGAFCG